MPYTGVPARTSSAVHGDNTSAQAMWMPILNYTTIGYEPSGPSNNA